MLFLLLGGLLAAWYLQYILYRKWWDKSLAVDIRFTDLYAYEGDSSILAETISNGKRMPLPALEVRLSMSRNLEFSGEAKENSNITDQTYKRDMFSFFGHQKVIRRLPFTCTRRGFYEITKSELVGYDLFYSHSYYREVGQSAWMYVYPRQVDASRLNLICQALSGMTVTQSRLYPDPFEFSGIREYRPTDPMNQINWKASARNSSLMVNQYDSTTSVQVTVVLDVEDSRILKYEELTEESIRIASSLAARLVKRGMELDFLGNFPDSRISGEPGSGQSEGPDRSFSLQSDRVSGESAGGTERPRRLLAASLTSCHIKTPAQVQELNRRLARLSLSGEVLPITELLGEESAGKPCGRIYVLVSKNQTPEIKAALKPLAACGSQILWVCPVHPHMEAAERGGGWLRFLRWEVE